MSTEVRITAGGPVAGRGAPDDLVVRIAVLTADACAIAGLAVAGLLPGWAAVGGVLATTAGSALARRAIQAPRWRPWRLAAWMTVAVVTVWLAVAGPLSARPPAVLGTLIAGFVAATAADQDGSRLATLVNLALGLAVLALSAGLAPGPGLAFPVAGFWLAGLVVLHRVGDRGAPDVGQALAGPGARSPAGRRLAGSLALTAVTALATFGAVRSLPIAAVSGRAPAAPFEVVGGAARVGSGPARNADASFGAPMDLRARRTLDPRPLFDVPSASPRLWRAGVLQTYTGSGWLPADGPTTVIGGGVVAVPIDADDPQVDAGAALVRADVRSESGDDLLITSPGVTTTLHLAEGVQAVRLPGGRTFVVGRDGRPMAVPYDLVALARPDVDDVAGVRLAAARVAASPTARTAENRTTELIDADPRWTALPAALPGRVRRLAATLAATPDAATANGRAAAVRAVEAYLRRAASYRLDSPEPASGEDAVDDFLFVSRTGFCEQFASAEAVLLRAVRIPARVVVGFAGGVAAPDGRRTVREQDAHAWVEVYLPGIGWASSDPTAGAVAASPGRSWSSGALRWAAGHASLDVAGVVVPLAAFVFAAGTRRRREGGTAGGGPDRGGPSEGDPGVDPLSLPSAFDRLETSLAAAGRPRRPTESLADLAVRLAGDQDACAGLRCLERAMYGPHPPTAGQILVATRALDAAAARVGDAPGWPSPETPPPGPRRRWGTCG